MWMWIANKFAKFHAKKTTEVKIFQKLLGGYFFWNTLYIQNIHVLYRVELCNKMVDNFATVITFQVCRGFGDLTNWAHGAGSIHWNTTA